MPTRGRGPWTDFTPGIGAGAQVFHRGGVDFHMGSTVERVRVTHERENSSKPAGSGAADQ